MHLLVYSLTILVYLLLNGILRYTDKVLPMCHDTYANNKSNHAVVVRNLKHLPLEVI